jgi:signal transduction histidine kinase
VLDDIKQGTVFAGERVRLAQIIENLLSNGIKYKNPEREHQFVKVSAWNENDSLHLNIADNGLGIPQKYLSDVFKMFKRFHPAVSSGSGLGLSIVKKHVDSLNGTIQVTSSDAGTQFKITLPMGVIGNE